MTTAPQILDDLAQCGVTVRAHGERLQFHPVNRVTPGQLAELRTHKAELLSLLTTTTVANIRNLPTGWLEDSRYVYIGRPNPRAKLPGSPFANPFRIGKDGDRAEVIEKYRTWIRSRPELMQRAATELRGKTLVCWCSPEACHGDVLAELVNGPATSVCCPWCRSMDLIDGRRGVWCLDCERLAWLPTPQGGAVRADCVTPERKG